MIACVLGLAVASQASAAETYQAGVEASFPPWSYVEGGEFKSIAVDAVREIAKEKGFNVEFKDLPWTSLVPALASNKIDVLVTGMFVTKERNEVIDYTVPWWETNDVVLISTTDKRTIASALCCDAKVGTQSGSGWERWIDDNFVNGEFPTKVTMQTYDDPIAATEDLRTGRINSIVFSADVAADLISKGLPVKEVGSITTRRPWAIAAGKDDPKRLLAVLGRGDDLTDRDSQEGANQIQH
ncbi:amino acid ABC transporter substrate-binding protein (plasmid) [Rhizobium sp. NXC24]|nr:amino acid ABC transporter substrate-binding protein [Rhizobium sp. NXC24]